MPRTTINLPEQFPFSTVYTVLVTDLNYGNHVGNDRYLGIIHEARCRYYHWLGYEESNFGGTGIVLFVASVSIEYKKELKYPDIVSISAISVNHREHSFDMKYLIEKEEDGKKVIVARVEQSLVSVDKATKKITQLPIATIEHIKTKQGQLPNK
ncbi:MAG: thioesterase family protein [Phycisphaerales bacterium]|nr:thioesterase family protein [Phycisphaerales bacterium]